MNTIHPWQLLLITIAGWINRHQQYVIDYLVEENRVLKGQLRGRRVRLTDDERRRLAVKGKILARKVLEEVATIVTPDTIMAWFRRLVARKWDYSLTRNKTGRPRTDVEISDLILRLLNAYAERFVLSIKTECLDRMIFFTEQSLRRATASFVDHYHRERCHQGLGNRLIEPDESPQMVRFDAVSDSAGCYGTTIETQRRTRRRLLSLNERRRFPARAAPTDSPPRPEANSRS